MYVLNILNMLYTLRFFSSKCGLFHNPNLFGSCIIHTLYTGCAKVKKSNSGAKGLIHNFMLLELIAFEIQGGVDVTLHQGQYV